MTTPYPWPARGSPPARGGVERSKLGGKSISEESQKAFREWLGEKKLATYGEVWEAALEWKEKRDFETAKAFVVDVLKALKPLSGKKQK